MATPLLPSRPLGIRATGAAPTCANCPVRQLCLPAGMDEEGVAGIDRLVERRHVLQRGDTLYQMDEPVHDRLYAIRSGTIKSYQLFADGVQRIIGFPADGDLLGLETLGAQQHSGIASALTECTVCELSYSRITAAARQSAALARQFETALSKELARQQSSTLVLSYAHADQKLANFLLAYGWSTARRGGSATTLQLPMSRQDMGDYLGLTDATVSRLLRQLQRRGCLAVHQRQITITDPDMLRAIAAGQQPQPLTPPSGSSQPSGQKMAAA
jgi:CRP/FNR family transcriptional regulator